MISVIIPAYNEEKAIRNCLTALVGQKTSYKFEVIVVDNNSTDNTVSIARTFADTLDITIVHERKKGRGAARRTGFAKAKGSIFLSTDADTVVPPEWVEHLTTSLKKSEAIAVSGTCRINDCNAVTNTIFNACMPFFMRFYRLFFGHYWLSGFNFAITSDAYHKSGGFADNLTALEDIDLSFRVSKIGNIRMTSEIPVLFSGRRFQNGIISGLLQYIKPFLSYYFLGRKSVALADIR